MTKAAALYVFCGLIVFLFVFNTWQNYLSYSKASTCFVINPIHLIWEALREWKAPCWQTENWLWIPDLLRVTSMGITKDLIRAIIGLMWSSGIIILLPAEEPDRRQHSEFFERSVVLCRVGYAMLPEHLRKRGSQSTTLKSKFKDDGFKDFMSFIIYFIMIYNILRTRLEFGH